MENKAREIVNFIIDHPLSSSKDIHEGVQLNISYATVKRVLDRLHKEKFINIEGRGRGTRYVISMDYAIIHPIDIHEYFEKEIDEREVKVDFQLDLISKVLTSVELFSIEENKYLQDLQKEFLKKLQELQPSEYEREMERLAIDLSWKSSQIEGNTYSLLETERLLKDKETASGKHKDEATMLLNHKEALDFVLQNPDYLDPIEVRRIEDVHSILIKDLGIGRNIRTRRAGITGTNYRPIDNEFQIREQLFEMCKLVNSKKYIFEKALLVLILVSYIQPFHDGNKRAARIVSNALLISNNYCPISFRTVDSIEYKKALLVFYEKNNISAFKKIFIEQYEFAVRTYF